ncbi:MAG: hypothetical protein KatS3mg002_0875 [Candidatus Woesearchaeota archaeon]|nr:MAG: hypothetical protein KatS3mg002_0875 [Candidatus Woesearchaeota archaeon]
MRIVCLAIESTAHTFGASVVEFDNNDYKILSNVRDMYKTEKGGIIPVELSEHHVNCFDKVIEESLTKAGKTLNQINLIAFSQGPGIGHALRIGATVARSISIRTGIPFNRCKIIALHI